jgi:hypothetical protein
MLQIIARQRLGKHLSAMNTHSMTEELLDAVFPLRSVPYRIVNMY